MTLKILNFLLVFATADKASDFSHYYLAGGFDVYVSLNSWGNMEMSRPMGKPTICIGENKDAN